MDKFVIEKFDDGEMLQDTIVESDQRLLNEHDLDTMCYNYIFKGMLFVRESTDTANGYFVADDGRWDYGTREQAVNTIKRRL